MLNSAERYTAWRIADNKANSFIIESEYPQAHFPNDYLVSTVGNLVTISFKPEAVRDYRPNFVQYNVEQPDGSWVTHREDGPAWMCSQPATTGSWLEDTLQPVIGAGSHVWYLYGEEVEKFKPEQIPLILLSLTELE